MAEKLTIFYTDDDQEDLEFFKEATDAIDRDLEVVTIDGGPKLIDAIENPPPHPHILFLDLNMPGLTGFDVIEILRQREGSKDIPIVVFSTSRDENYIKKSLELGANYYVPKSTSFDSLRKSIEHTINIDWTNFTTTPNNFLYHN